MIYFRRNL